MKWFRRKKYLFAQMSQHQSLIIFCACQFSYLEFKVWFQSQFCNTVCWSSGKDSGLSPRRPQFESHSYQAFLEKDFPWKFFKKRSKSGLKIIWGILQNSLFLTLTLVLLLQNGIIGINRNYIACNKTKKTNQSSNAFSSER